MPLLEWLSQLISNHTRKSLLILHSFDPNGSPQLETHQICPLTLLAHSKEIQPLFRRFKLCSYWEHSKVYMCPRTWKSIAKGQLCTKSTYHWNKSVTSSCWVQFPKGLAFNDISILEIWCQNWIILCGRNRGRRGRERVGYSLNQAQILFEDKLCFWNVELVLNLFKSAWRPWKQRSHERQQRKAEVRIYVLWADRHNRKSMQ
jgi:hypothetical protein